MMTGGGLSWASLRVLNWESKLRVCVAYACYSVWWQEEDCPGRASGCWTESLNWGYVLLMLVTVYEDGRKTPWASLRLLNLCLKYSVWGREEDSLGEPQVAELMLKIQCMRTGGGLSWASLRVLNWESKLRVCVAYACYSVWWQEEDCPGRASGCWTEGLNWGYVLLILVTVYEDGKSLRLLNWESKLRICVAYACYSVWWRGGGLSWTSLRLVNWESKLRICVAHAYYSVWWRGEDWLAWASLRLLNWESKLRLCVVYACCSVRGRAEDCPGRVWGCWTKSLNWGYVLFTLVTVYEDVRRTGLGEPQVAELRD